MQGLGNLSILTMPTRHPGDKDRVCSQEGGPAQAGPHTRPDEGLWLFWAALHLPCFTPVSFPGQEALMSIYSTILSQHLSYRAGTLCVVQKMSSHLVASALGKPASLAPSPVRKTCCIRC